jgi:hypothetical protein
MHAMSSAHVLSTARRQRGKFIIFLGVAAFAMTALMACLVWSGHRDAIRTAETTSRNCAATIEARLDGTLRRADAILKDGARTLPAAAPSRQTVPRYGRELNTTLDFRLVSFPELAGIRILGASGDRLYAPNSASTLVSDLADRSYFQVLRDNPGARLVFSEVVISRSPGKSRMVAARALRDSEGAFRGVVIASADLEHCQRQFHPPDSGARGVLSVHRTDDFSLVERGPKIDSTPNMSLPLG